jgi:hypothetical protein
VAELREQVKELRREAAERRTAAKRAEDEKVAAERSAAEQKGEWSKVLDLERKERERLQGEVTTHQRRVAELEPYEGAVKAEVSALRAKLGDKAPPVDGLSDAQALRILRYAESLATAGGAPAAKPTTAAAPAGSATSQGARPDFSKMTEAEQAAYVKSLSLDEVRKLAREQGLTGQNASPFS